MRSFSQPASAGGWSCKVGKARSALPTRVNRACPDRVGTVFAPPASRGQALPTPHGEESRMNKTIAKLGRRLRLGVIGGGPGSFIGPVHRAAARIDDNFEIVASVLSSKPARSRQEGRAIGIAADRAYGAADEMFAKERTRADGMEVVAIMTPNDSHCTLSRTAIEHGLDIICDKPLATNLEDALDLQKRVKASGIV